MKAPHCIPSCASMQMVILVFFCQMIAQSHLLPFNQQELAFMIDPVAQAPQDSLESKKVVAKSVFDVPMKTTVPPLIRCPPDSQRAVEGGPCVPTASSITVKYNLFQQLAKESVHFNNRRKPGPGHKTKHRTRTTTVSPRINLFGTSTSSSTGSRPAPLVHSQDSSEKQPAHTFPSTAYVLQSPQENLPLPINQQMTSMNPHQPLQPINNDEIMASSTITEISTAAENMRDLTTTAVSTEVSGATATIVDIGSTLSDITDSLAISLSTTFRSTDQVTEKSSDADLETSSSTRVPQPFQMFSNPALNNSGLIGKASTFQNTIQNVGSVNSDVNATRRPDEQDFHFNTTTTNTEQQTETPLRFGNKDHHNANNTTEKVWFSEDVKSTIEPPIAAEEFNGFSPGSQSNSEQMGSKIEFATNRETYLPHWIASTSPPTSFATIESLIPATEERRNPISSAGFNENNFATTPISSESWSSSSAKDNNGNPLENDGRNIMITKKDISNESGTTTTTTPRTWTTERLRHPEFEIDFEVDEIEEDISTEQPALPAAKNLHLRHSPTNPSSFLTVRPSHMKTGFISQSQNDNTNPTTLRSQILRNRDPIITGTGSTDHPQPVRTRQRNHNLNQFYVDDYLTFNSERPSALSR